jgi:hypothetical protein
MYAHAIHHRQEQIAHRRFLAIDNPTSGLHEVTAPAGDQRGQILGWR